MHRMVYAVYTTKNVLYYEKRRGRWKYNIRPLKTPDLVVCNRKPLYPHIIRGLERVSQGIERYVPYIYRSRGYMVGISWYVDIWWIIPFSPVLLCIYGVASLYSVAVYTLFILFNLFVVMVIVFGCICFFLLPYRSHHPGYIFFIYSLYINIIKKSRKS